MWCYELWNVIFFIYTCILQSVFPDNVCNGNQDFMSFCLGKKRNGRVNMYGRCEMISDLGQNGCPRNNTSSCILTLANVWWLPTSYSNVVDAFIYCRPLLRGLVNLWSCSFSWLLWFYSVFSIAQMHLTCTGSTVYMQATTHWCESCSQHTCTPSICGSIASIQSALGW